MRALCYVQHRNGVGHYVRMHTIAAALAEHHETVLVEGGAPVPRPRAGAEPRRLWLPELGRDRERVERLAAGARELRPDVVVVEHYPFSKWELDPEIEALLAAARDANRGVLVVSSLRDIPPRRRHLTHTPEYDARVLDRLRRSFDAVLVHTDPDVLRFADHFPAADRLPVALHHTGVVVGPATDPIETRDRSVVATADGPDATRFLLAVIAAFGELRATGSVDTLHVFADFGAPASEIDALHATATDGAVVVHPFTSDYMSHLAGAALSVSRGGYNTIAEVVRTRIPAVVVPEPRTDDQVPRAAAFARAGALDVVDGPLPDPAALADAIRRAYERGRPSPTVDLTGAPTTREILESLVSE